MKKIQNIIEKIDLLLNKNKKIKKIKSLNDFFKEKKIKNGVYSINLKENLELKILIKNLKHLKSNDAIIVNFNGAVSNRKEKKGPFFSGNGISEQLKVPLIAISDPLLDINKNLKLAWYLGNKEVPNLPVIIAELLEYISKKLNKKLVIFGGSGGGFASLVQGTLLNCEADILVWNPQTSVKNYSIQFVKEYCEAAGFKNLNEDNQLLHDLHGKPLKENARVIYLQNKNDWHLKKHMEPYLEHFKMINESEKISCDEEKNIYTYTGNWGEGHATPNREVILTVLKGFLKGEKLESIISDIDDRNE